MNTWNGRPLPVLSVFGVVQEIRRERFRLGAVGGETRRDGAVDGRGRRVVAAVHEELGCVRLRREAGDGIGGRTPPQRELAAASAHRLGKRAQRSCEPPPRRAAERAQARARFVEQIEAYDGPPGRRCGGKGRVVGEPQIVAKPDDERTAATVGVTGHQSAPRRRTFGAGPGIFAKAIII